MFKNLETFKTVYEERNFTQAAEKLYISQPTVSTQIQQLEELLTTKLFIRNGRQEVIPTESGKQFYIQLEKMIDLWEETTQQVAALKGSYHQTCHIGASHTIAVQVMPDLLAYLQSRFPLIDFDVHLGNSEKVMKEVEARNWQMGFIETPLATTTLIREAVMEDELVHAGNFEENLWLIREVGSGVHSYTVQYFETANIVPERKMVIESNEMVARLLAKGVGQTIIAKNALIEGTPYRQLDRYFTRSFYYLYPEKLSGTLDAVKQACQQFFKEKKDS